MIDWLSGIPAYLQSLDPRLWPLTIAIVVGVVYWLWKRVHPTSFADLPSKLKALPGAILAAMLSGLAGQDLLPFILDTVIGSLVAGGGHEFVARAIGGSKAERVRKKRPWQRDET